MNRSEEAKAPGVPGEENGSAKSTGSSVEVKLEEKRISVNGEWFNLCDHIVVVDRIKNRVYYGILLRIYNYVGKIAVRNVDTRFNEWIESQQLEKGEVEILRDDEPEAVEEVTLD